MRQLSTMLVAVMVASLWPAMSHAKKKAPSKGAATKTTAKAPIKAEVRSATGDFVISVRSGTGFKQLVLHSYCDPVLEEKLAERDAEAPDGYEYCMESYEDAVDEVPGSKGRLWFVQLLAEQGEDFKTRKVSSWIVDIATQRVLDTDTGEYRADYDYKQECTDETWDVPWAKVKKGKLVLYRDEGGGCKKRWNRLKVIKRMRLPVLQLQTKPGAAPKRK